MINEFIEKYSNNKLTCVNNQSNEVFNSGNAYFNNKSVSTININAKQILGNKAGQPGQN